MAGKKKPLKPAAFLSYVRFDDKHEDGRISELRERLSTEIRAQTGVEFPIFQDRNDIHWGENWESRIENALDGSTFLIPVITPSFFKSPSCRKELERFLEREAKLKRNDLILPIYYIEIDLKKAKRDHLLKIVFEHQYADWREMRFELATSPQFSRALAQLATEVRDAVSRSPRRKKPGIASRKKPRETKPEETAEREAIAKTEGLVESATQATATALPSEKSEPRVRLVDVSGQGEFTNIHDAIIAASPGERILIRPGIYQEKLLLIDKPLEIIGTGDTGKVIVRGLGESVIDFMTVLGRLSNLKIEHQGAERYRGVFNQAVYIRQGKLEVENCQIVTQGALCVTVSAGADPRLRNLHLRSSGIAMIFSGGHGALEDSDVYSESTTIGIGSNANPTMRRNKIHTQKAGLTIQVFNDAAGLFEFNEISGGSTAVDIKWGARPTLRSNIIHNARDCGVSISEGGEGLLENNQIVNNTEAGIRVMSEGNPTVRENKITGQNIGIEISNASGMFEKNDLRGNFKSAWSIAADSVAKIVRAENLE